MIFDQRERAQVQTGGEGDAPMPASMAAPQTNARFLWARSWSAFSMQLMKISPAAFGLHGAHHVASGRSASMSMLNCTTDLSEFATLNLYCWSLSLTYFLVFKAAV